MGDQRRLLPPLREPLLRAERWNDWVRWVWALPRSRDRDIESSD